MFYTSEFDVIHIELCAMTEKDIKYNFFKFSNYHHPFLLISHSRAQRPQKAAIFQL